LQLLVTLLVKLQNAVIQEFFKLERGKAAARRVEALGILEGSDAIQEDGTCVGAIFFECDFRNFPFLSVAKTFHTRVIVAPGFCGSNRGNVVDFKVWPNSWA